MTTKEDTVKRGTRRLLVCGLLVALLISAAPPAGAFVTIAGNGTPTSDGFHLGGSTLSGISISNGTGFLTTGCAVGNTGSCTDTGFSIRVVTSDFSSSYDDLCVATDAYTPTGSAAVKCDLNNGVTSSAQAGALSSGSVAASGCNSWNITWPKADSSLYYVDVNPTLGTNVAFQLYSPSIGLSLGNYAYSQAADTWTLTGTLTGEGYDNVGTHYTATFTIAATATVLLSHCGGGTRPTQFSLTGINATATITSP